MHTSENDTENGSARSFWEPKQYSRTVKRRETANKLCSEFALMIQERSDIEKAYASNLRKWSQRWNTFNESGLEYGTGANVFSGLCTEAEQRADLHLNVANNLTESVQASVKSWQKANFHKTSISSTIKEVRALEAEFEAAQKVWYKRFKAVNRAQKEYYHACKTVGSLQVQVQNARNDPSGTPEQLRKIEEKLTKAEQDKVKTRGAYEHALNNLTDENMHYIDEMTKVFEKSQKSEKERLDFFKTQAFAMHKFLDLSKMPQLADIYAKLERTINLADSEADLKQWSFSHGVDMPTNFPKFEEYSPELAPLGHKKRSAISDSNPGVTLTGVTSAPSPQMPKLPDESPSHSYKYSSASGVVPNSNLESAGESKTDLDTLVSQPTSSPSPCAETCEAGGDDTEDDGVPMSDGEIAATATTPLAAAVAVASSPNPHQASEAFETKSCLESAAGLQGAMATETNGHEAEMISPPTELSSSPPPSSSASDIDQASVLGRELTVAAAAAAAVVVVAPSHDNDNFQQQQQDLSANGGLRLSSSSSVDSVVAVDDTDVGQAGAKVKAEAVLSLPAHSDAAM